jgi:glycosyltransferase involved in cell wall biosynthesis
VEELASASPVPNPRPLRVTYLITSILAVTGGNMTLLNQVEELRRRGHKVTIVTYTDRPVWTRVNAEVIQVPLGEPMASRVPPSDAVISTYCANTHELLAVDAPAKVYYAQGDQFVFGDDTPAPDPRAERDRQALKEMSRRSYGHPGVHFVANSSNLADAVFRAHGVRAEAVLPVCTDQTIFRPLRRALPGSRRRILIVGPDTRGSGAESLAFKGIADIRRALELLSERFANFTAVRVSNSQAEIFRDFPCEYHLVPSDEMKTFLFGTADVLVYASHYDSCPRPPQEGMAAGCAVVCTATSGAKEYCVHEENCLLVPVQNPAAMADAILRVITDQALRERIIEGGKRTAARLPREREWNELEALLYTYVGAGVA